MLDLDHVGRDFLQRRPDRFVLPCPAVAEPKLRQQRELRPVGPAVVRRDRQQHVAGLCLRVFDEDVEVTAVRERAGIEQLVLRRADPAPAVLFHEIRIRERRLRILIEHLQIRMARRGVEIVVELLDVLTVIAFAVREPEEALFEDRVAAVPHRHAKAQPLLGIGETPDAVFTPAIHAAARVIVREVLPRVAVRAIVFAHGAPLALAQIRTPEFPRRTGRRRLHALPFDGRGRAGARHRARFGSSASRRLPWPRGAPRTRDLRRIGTRLHAHRCLFVG